MVDPDLLAAMTSLGPMGHHTSPEDAGSLFAKIQPALAVYTHIVLARTSVEDLVRRTRTTYAGPLEVGSDLMTIDVMEHGAASQ